MRIYRNDLLKRVCGTVAGIGFLSFGVFSVLAHEPSVSDDLADRAMSYGATLILAGVIAVAVSWMVRDLDDIWCRQPRRWRD